MYVLAHNRHGSVNNAENPLATFGWSEIMGAYNTAET